MYEKQFQIRQETLDRVDEYKNNFSITKEEAFRHVLILERQQDPFYFGSDADLICAEYAYTQWKRYIDETGEKNVHIRGLHYYLQALKTLDGPRLTKDSPLRNWTIYEHTDACYKYLQRGLKIARYLDLIPTTGIKDEKNDVTEITNYSPHTTEYQKELIMISSPVDIDTDIFLPSVDVNYDTVDDYISGITNRISRDLVLNIEFNSKLIKPFHVELWCEKTLPDYIKRIPGIDTIVEGSGALSATVANSFISRLNENKQDGIALYLTDFDPSGNTMPVEMARKIQFSKRKGELKQQAFLEPIAITKELIKKLQDTGINLPPKDFIFNKDIGKARTCNDTKKEKFIKNKAGYYIELQALEAYPVIYADIVRTAVNRWECDYSKSQTAIADAKRDLTEEIKGCLLDRIERDREQLEEWFDETIELGGEIQEAMPDCEEIENKFSMVNELSFSEKNKNSLITGLLNDILKNIELPVVIPPKLEQDPPSDDCLFDSRRDEQEQVDILKRYQKTGVKQ